MAKQNINLGTAPTGVGGDTPRSAFTKAQANFDELYLALTGKAASGANSDITSLAGLTTALSVAQGGTGGTTIAALRTALGLGSAAFAALVGTVSQSGGVANGDVMQRGSNTNGEWLKLADGTLFCMRRVLGPTFATSQYLQIEWTYPMQFSSLPQVFICGAATIDQIKYNRSVPGANPSLSSATIRQFATGTDTFAAGEGSSASAFAIGRWY